MKNKYPHIFEPITVRRMTVKNRIVMTPMGTNYGEQNGEMSFLHINYYEQRAKGGTGLIIVENASVDSPQGSNGTTQLRIDLDNYIPRLFKLCESVHKHGACIAIQLNHAGASAMSSRIGMQPVSASDVPSKAGGEIPRPLEKDEIMHIVKKYGEAAKRAQICGFDAVEIHAGHSYLISQFLSPITNKRTDEFGGSAENRARFAKLVIEEVRKQVGPFFPIFVRISADELMEGGNTLEDTLEYLKYFEKEVDVFDVSCGLNGSIQYQIDANYLPDGWRSFMAKAVKEKYNKPCITVGNIRDPQVAEDILAGGDADFIGMGRGLIADPEWVNKVEFGNVCDIRKCISCNIGCAGHRIGLNQPIRCTVNPAVNSGEDYMKTKVNKPCNVVVIGGGTAGLEAACTAAEVGCTTFLIEKKAELGGLASVISKIPDKKRLADFPNYMIHRASKLHNLFVFKNTAATVDMVKALNPDIIVNATGSVPTLPPITGLHDHGIDIKGKKITVAGGGGAATAIQVQCALDGAREITIFNKNDAFFERTLQTAEKIKKAVPDCIVNVYDIDDTAKMTEEIQSSDIFANATIVGMKPLDDQSVVKDLSAFRPGLVVADAVYNPEETKLLREAKEAGCTCVGGKGMLLWQGVAAFKLYTGQDMPVDDVKKLFFS